MKKMNLFTSATLCMALAFTSCSKSDSGDDCHECHIALENQDGTETMWEITNSSGGEDFCANDLTTVEDPSYMHTVTDTLTSSDGLVLVPGEYGVSNGYEIHCEEHADH
tara:strand:+ start:189 stop:515 length:327 start_codon:yes stop_codon:yes gene_type:complete